MTVSFKVAEQPSKLKVHTLGLKCYQCSFFFTLIAANVPYNYYESLYFNFICKVNFQIIITGNYASNLQQTLHACISQTYAMSSPISILFNTGLGKSAIICSARTYNFQSIPLTICNRQCSYFCCKQIKESINGMPVH